MQHVYFQGNLFSADVSKPMELTYALDISAGFPSPATDYMDLSLDLNTELVKNPEATFYGRVKGYSMRDEGVLDGDVLVIDRSIAPSSGVMAVCYLDGAFTLKKIEQRCGRTFLMPANPNFKPIEITESNELIVWGVVTYVIKKIKG